MMDQRALQACASAPSRPRSLQTQSGLVPHSDARRSCDPRARRRGLVLLGHASRVPMRGVGRVGVALDYRAGSNSAARSIKAGQRRVSHS
jgi:hypothetical protein